MIHSTFFLNLSIAGPNVRVSGELYFSAVARPFRPFCYGSLPCLLAQRQLLLIRCWAILFYWILAPGAHTYPTDPKEAPLILIGSTPRSTCPCRQLVTQLPSGLYPTPPFHSVLFLAYVCKCVEFAAFSCFFYAKALFWRLARPLTCAYLMP